MPLSSLPFIRSQNAHEVEQFVASVLGAKITHVSGIDKLDLRADYYQSSQVSLWFCAYGTALKKEYPVGNYYRLQLQHKGAASTTLANGQQVLINRQQGCISEARASMDYGAGYEQFALRIDESLLRQKLSLLIDRDVGQAIRFDSAIKIGSPSLIQKNFGFFLELVNLTKANPLTSLPLKEIEQALIVALLCESQHNYSGFLGTAPAQIAPWRVREVEEFIHANWNQPLTLENMSRTTQVSVRSIFRGFKETYGVTPMDYVKKLRLQKAHMILRSRDNKYSVARVAHMCGFASVSHFSRVYLHAYGENPSVTFRRQK